MFHSSFTVSICPVNDKWFWFNLMDLFLPCLWKTFYGHMAFSAQSKKKTEATAQWAQGFMWVLLWLLLRVIHFNWLISAGGGWFSPPLADRASLFVLDSSAAHTGKNAELHRRHQTPESLRLWKHWLSLTHIDFWTFLNSYSKNRIWQKTWLWRGSGIRNSHN